MLHRCRGSHGTCDGCSGRLAPGADDQRQETADRRLRNFEVETIPLITHYRARGELEVIDSTQDEADVHDELIARVAARCTRE